MIGQDFLHSRVFQERFHIHRDETLERLGLGLLVDQLLKLAPFEHGIANRSGQRDGEEHRRNHPRLFRHPILPPMTLSVVPVPQSA